MIQLFNEDNLKVMETMPDHSIDVICIDPPYLYLKNQKLERPFDERLFFSECKRLLKDKGFIVMFGRGVSFYRWNCILDELGMTFKEEIVWDKQYNSSPTLPLSRMHEMCALYSYGTSKINKVKVDYLESKKHDHESILQDFKRLIPMLRNDETLKRVLSYMESGVIPSTGRRKLGSVNLASDATDHLDVNSMVTRSIIEGMQEKSIIRMAHEKYGRIHPTQKPSRLIERLLALVIPDKPRNEIVVADFFGGSMSTMEAVHNMGMNGISTEIDDEYFLAGKARIDALLSKPKQEKLDL